MQLDCLSMATTDGSDITTPRPRTKTSVFAVPRSMPRSLEKAPKSVDKGLRMAYLSGCPKNQASISQHFLPSGPAIDSPQRSLICSQHRYKGGDVQWIVVIVTVL